jgi:hypothetical protein
LIEDKRPRTVVFTGPLAVELDERQYIDGCGPCTDAAVTGTCQPGWVMLRTESMSLLVAARVG